MPFAGRGGRDDPPFPVRLSDPAWETERKRRFPLLFLHTALPQGKALGQTGQEHRELPHLGFALVPASKNWRIPSQTHALFPDPLSHSLRHYFPDESQPAGDGMQMRPTVPTPPPSKYPAFAGPFSKETATLSQRPAGIEIGIRIQIRHQVHCIRGLS